MQAVNERKQGSKLDNFFKLTQNHTTVKTEIIAGITTFMAMAYIIAVNPGVLSAPFNIMGMPEEAAFYSQVVFGATCLAAAIGTFIMGLYANLPFAQAPGMGLNAFFAYTVILTMGLSFREALAAVAISGFLFIAITLFGLRELIVEAIPENLKNAITVGIGLFIALLGLRNSGIAANSEATGLTLLNFATAEPMQIATAVLSLLGLAIMGVLMMKKVKGAMLIGIASVTILGIPFGITPLENLKNATWGFKMITGAEYMEKVFPDFSGLFNKFGATGVLSTIFAVIMIVIAFSLVDMFDTIGTLIGTGSRTGLVNEKGELPNLNKALMADAVATAVGAFMGTSTVTTFVESGSGIEAGGRTGLTSVVTGILFVLALFIAPIIGIIPTAATAPALIMVGVLMMGNVKNVKFGTIDDALPAFVTIAFMPFTYSIANGIAAGFIFYPIMKIASGKVKEVHWLVYILAALFIIRFGLLPA